MVDIVEKIKERQKKKTNVNLTIDVDLFVALEKFKKDNGLTQLSPMINEMLWDWLNTQKKKEEGNKK